MIRCAVFDADGTLLDSMSMWQDITLEYIRSKGLSAPADICAIMNRMSLEEGADYIQKVLGLSESYEEIRAAQENLAIEGYREKVSLKPGALEFLRLLHENGISVGIATASYNQSIEDVLTRTGVSPYVTALVTCTDVGVGKDRPDVFLECAKRCGACPKETVVFEDSLHALKTAHCAGFSCVAVWDDFSREQTEQASEGDPFAPFCTRQILDFTGILAELTGENESLSKTLGSLFREPTPLL